MATAEAIREHLGVVPPLTIKGPGIHADGGSYGGSIIGSGGDTLMFFISYPKNRGLPTLFLGDDGYQSGNAVLVEPKSVLEQAVVAAISLYSGNTVPYLGEWVISSTGRSSK